MSNTNQLDLMDYYSNYDKFIAEPIQNFIPEVNSLCNDAYELFNVTWLLTMNSVLKYQPEQWPNFLKTVEQGYEILNVREFIFPEKADTRTKMYVASLICYLVKGNYSGYNQP